MWVASALTRGSRQVKPRCVLGEVDLRWEFGQHGKEGLWSASPAAAQKQDEAHDVFVLLRLVGVDRDRGDLPVVVKNRIA